jgi:hypothetical protein
VGAGVEAVCVGGGLCAGVGAGVVGVGAGAGFDVGVGTGAGFDVGREFGNIVGIGCPEL